MKTTTLIITAIVTILGASILHAQDEWIPNTGQIKSEEVTRATSIEGDYVTIKLTNVTQSNLSVKVVQTNPVKRQEPFTTRIGGPGKTSKPVFLVQHPFPVRMRIYYKVN